jgi:hypothetical protein
MLGACAFYARYGMPGAEVQRWMQGAGGNMAIDRSSLASPTKSARMWFGWHLATDPLNLAVAACTAGKSETCASLLTQEFLDQNDDMEQVEPRVIEAGIPLLDGSIRYLPVEPAYDEMRQALARLEERFGQERFAAFWHSDRSVPEAFESAFGISAAEWGLELARRASPGEARAAVMPGGSEVGLTALYLVLAGMIGIGLSRKRRVA